MNPDASGRGSGIEQIEVTRFRYRFAGLDVESMIALPLLDRTMLRNDGTAGPPELLIGTPADLDVESIRRDGRLLFADAQPPGDWGVSVYSWNGEYLLRFAPGADLLFDPASRRLTPVRGSWSQPADLQHVLLDQAMPRALAHFGHLILHASAVAVDGRAICCVGPSGSGKSTLAAALVGAGATLLADDAVRIELSGTRAATVFSSYSSLRLWDDSVAMLGSAPVSATQSMAGYSSKNVLQLSEDRIDTAPFSIGHLLLLHPAGSSQPTWTTDRSPRAIVDLIAQSFAVDPSHDSGKRFAGYVELARRLAPVRLHMPHDFGLLRQVLEPLLRGTRLGSNRNGATQ